MIFWLLLKLSQLLKIIELAPVVISNFDQHFVSLSPLLLSWCCHFAQWLSLSFDFQQDLTGNHFHYSCCSDDHCYYYFYEVNILVGRPKVAPVHLGYYYKSDCWWFYKLHLMTKHLSHDSVRRADEFLVNYFSVSTITRVVKVVAQGFEDPGTSSFMLEILVAMSSIAMIILIMIALNDLLLSQVDPIIHVTILILLSLPFLLSC